MEISIPEEKEKRYRRQFTEEQKQLQDSLKTFYDQHFDVNQIFKVIDRKTFETREFGFEVMGRGFTRNKSFTEPVHLKTYLSTFPVTGSYIGSLYKDRLLPKDRYFEAVTIHTTEWLGRELVFDLDMDEYDPVRTCKCKGREVCEICWGFMQDAAAIMDETLEVDFGFEKRIWVYTGGRGYHCHVLDEHTFKLDQTQRTAIVEYMQLIHDPKGNQRIDDVGDHATLLKRRIYRQLGRKFIKESARKLLVEEAGFKSEGNVTSARNKLKNTEMVSDIIDVIPAGKEKQFMHALIKWRYPRIDHKVTIDIRRLIRMPGTVHGKTLNIGEYVDPMTFNPMTDATNLKDILEE